MNAYDVMHTTPTNCIPDFVTSTNEAMEYVGIANDRNAELFSKSVSRMTAGYFTESGYVHLNEASFEDFKNKVLNALKKLWGNITKAFEFVLEKIKNLCSMIASKVPDYNVISKHLQAADPKTELGEIHENLFGVEIKPDANEVDNCITDIENLINNASASANTITKLDYDSYAKEHNIPAFDKDMMDKSVKKLSGDSTKVTVAYVNTNLKKIYETATQYNVNKNKIKHTYDYERKVIGNLSSKVKAAKNIEAEGFNKAFNALSKAMTYETKVSLKLLDVSYKECAKLLRAASRVKAAKTEAAWF